MKKVLVVQPMHEAGYEVLRRRDDIAFEVLIDVSEEELAAKVAEADAVILRGGRMTAEMVSTAPRLKILSRHGVGLDNVPVAALTARRIPLTVVGAASAPSVAEHALYMMMCLAKQALRYDRETRAGNFALRYTNGQVELWRKTVLVVGHGRIGSLIARRCRALEMEVLVADPYIDRKLITAAGHRPVDDFRAVLPEVDFVTLHVPLTEETRGMIGRDELAAMRPSAFLVNTARGEVVDETALVAALEAGTIAGAGLDVFADEPPDPGHPLFRLDNVIVSPHSAGSSLECAERVAVRAAQNVLDAFDGRLDPEFVVNPEVL